MRRILIISLLAFAACKGDSGAQKQQNSLVNNPRSANGTDTVSAAMKPTMEFVDTLHDFGVLHEGETVSYDFSFVNKGKTPLIITNAAGSCGCTVPDYPHEPIAPGKPVNLKVTFNSTGKEGTQNKSVTIHTNTMRSIHMLYIKADVKKNNWFSVGRWQFF